MHLSMLALKPVSTMNTWPAKNETLLFISEELELELELASSNCEFKTTGLPQTMGLSVF